MVELVVLQSISYIVGATGVFIAAVFYVLNLRISLRNQELSLKTQEHTLDTRQAQLFMQIFDNFYSQGYRKSLMELSDSWTWTDFDDFLKKYGPDTNLEAYEKFRFLFAQIDRMGMLVNWELIDSERLHRWGGGAMIRLWEKFEPIVLEIRTRERAMLYEDFEDFYYRLKELEEKYTVDFREKSVPTRIEKRKALGLKPIQYPQ
jgi:hypothetical protein